MWQIEENFNDPSHPTGKGMVVLKADKEMNPYTISYPIVWSCLINNKDIKIIQKRPSAILLSDFEFIAFPEIYSNLKSDIVGWIHRYLRVLN